MVKLWYVFTRPIPAYMKSPKGASPQGSGGVLMHGLDGGLGLGADATSSGGEGALATMALIVLPSN